MQSETAAVIACDLLPGGEPPPPGEPARQAPSTGRATARLPAFIASTMAATLSLQVIAASTALACQCMPIINATNACTESPFAFTGRVTKVKPADDGFDVTFAVLESLAGNVPESIVFRVGGRHGCALLHPFPEGSILRVFLLKEQVRKINSCTYVERVGEHDIATGRCGARADTNKGPNRAAGCAPCAAHGPGGGSTPLPVWLLALAALLVALALRARRSSPSSRAARRSRASSRATLPGP